MVVTCELDIFERAIPFLGFQCDIVNGGLDLFERIRLDVVVKSPVDAHNVRKAEICLPKGRTGSCTRGLVCTGNQISMTRRQRCVFCSLPEGGGGGGGGKERCEEEGENEYANPKRKGNDSSTEHR